MRKKSKLQIINDIPNEKYLREQVLKILLQKMGYKGVTVTHGADEEGKDIVFHEIDEKTGSNTFFAIVAKIGRLKAGSKSDNENIVTTYNQIRKSFYIKYDDVISKSKISIHRVWVVTNNNISNKARKEIIDFFGETADMIGRNVDFIDEHRLLDFLDKYWPEFFIQEEPFVYEYCSQLSNQFAVLDELKMFGYSKQLKHILDIFVQPTLIEEKKSEKKVTNIFDATDMKVHTLDSLLTGKDNIWLSGQAGCGKTTLLKHMILKEAEHLTDDVKNARIPCIINFRELMHNDDVRPIDLCIKEKICSYNKYGYDIVPDEWLKTGKIILFLDGFDEIPADHKKKTVIDALNIFTNSFVNIQVICTSRESEFEADLKLPRFKQVQIMPLNYKQMIKFIDRWFIDNESNKRDMLDALRKTVMSGKLPKTPMVMTLLAILFEEQPIKELPANMTELYTMFTELYLGRWDTQRSIETLFDYHLKDNVLLNLAYDMHQKNIDKLSQDAIMMFIEDYATERRTPIIPSQLIAEIVGRSQLIFIDPKGLYSFKHLSFQEYFASKYLIQKEDTKELIISKSMDPWWEYVVFFYVGSKKDAPQILSDIVNEAKSNKFADKYRKCLNVGQLLQAAYLTKHDTKVSILKTAIDEYATLYIEAIDLLKNKSLPKKMSQFLILFYFQFMFQKNYCSSTLIEAMKQLFYDIVKTDYCSNLPDLLKASLLSYTLATLSEKEPLEELASNPTNMDPLILLLTEGNLSELEFTYNTKFSPDVIKKIKKRVERSKYAILPYLSS
jgi:hypothetical protein